MRESSPAWGGCGRRASLFYGMLLLLYAGLTWLTIGHHELWRDEAYAWVVARDAGFLETFRLAAAENHLGLWYVLLMPLAKLGMPCFAMLVIHWILAVAAVAVFLWRAPFSGITKTLFIFSYYMFWEYCVSIRFYALSILIIFGLAAGHGNRFRLPILYATLLALLCNTNIHIEFLAAALFLAFIRDSIGLPEKRAGIAWAIAIMVLGIVAACLQIGKLPDPDIHGHSFQRLLPANILTSVVQAFFVSGPPAIMALAGFAILALAGYALATRPVPLLILGIHLAGTFIIYLFHTGGTRHHGLILIGVLVSLWLAVYYPDSERPIFRRIRACLPDFSQRRHTCMVALNLSLLMALPIGVTMHLLDLKHQYSGSQKMAQFIRANHLERYPIAAWRDAQTFPVLAYLPGKALWFAGLKKYGTHYVSSKERRWAFDNVTYEEALRNIDQAFPDNEPVLILLDVPLDTQRMLRYQLLFKVDDEVFGTDERIYLYLRMPAGTVSPAAGANRSLPGPRLLPPPTGMTQ